MQTENDTSKPETEPKQETGEGCQERLVRPWVDVTSFSQNAKDRTPRTWRGRFGKFDLILTRHIDYAPDQWTAYCNGVFPQRAMASKNLREAACQAKAMLQVELETAISEILGTNAELRDRPESATPPQNQPS